MAAVKTKQISKHFLSRFFGCCKLTGFDSQMHPYMSVIHDVNCNGVPENKSYKKILEGLLNRAKADDCLYK